MKELNILPDLLICSSLWLTWELGELGDAKYHRLEQSLQIMIILLRVLHYNVNEGKDPNFIICPCQENNVSQYNTSQHYTTLHYTKQHNTLQHHKWQHYIYNSTQQFTSQHNMSQQLTTQQNTIPNNTTQHNPTLYYTV